MSLNKPALKQAIKDCQNSASQEDNIADARETFASELSDAIEIFVKSGEVSVTTESTGTGYQSTPVESTGSGNGSVS